MKKDYVKISIEVPKWLHNRFNNVVSWGAKAHLLKALMYMLLLVMESGKNLWIVGHLLSISRKMDKEDKNVDPSTVFNIDEEEILYERDEQETNRINENKKETLKLYPERRT